MPVARIGILGGTFNPPHVGHLVCAQDALDQLGLDRVVLMPVHTPPHKEAPSDPGGEVRLHLCALATAGEEGIVSSFPCRCADGRWEIVQGLDVPAFSRERIDRTVAELREEREAVSKLGLV